MTAAELIEILKGVEPDTIVVMASDGEGNSYSPLSDYDYGHYQADSTWSGELLSSFDNYFENIPWTDFESEDEKEQEVEARVWYEELKEEAVPCVVVWPTN